MDPDVNLWLVALFALPAGALSVAVVVFVARKWAGASEAGKRAAEAQTPGCADLQPSPYAAASATWVSARPVAELLPALEEGLGGHGVRLHAPAPSELVGFFGDANASKVSGMRGTSPMDMAVRVALRLTAVDAGTDVQLWLSEDYGFHMFRGGTLKVFQDKYATAFEEWTDRIRALS